MIGDDTPAHAQYIPVTGMNPVATQPIADNLHLLVATLPLPLQDSVQALPQKDLLEIVMDLGRPPQARFSGYAVNLAKGAVSRLRFLR